MGYNEVWPLIVSLLQQGVAEVEVDIALSDGAWTTWVLGLEVGI